MTLSLRYLTSFHKLVNERLQSIFTYPKPFSHYFVSSSKFVIFRFDDIPFDFIQNRELYLDAELAVMNLFLKKNQKLSIGLVTKYLEEDDAIIEKIYEGLERSIFELAIHGWDHLDFSVLSEKQQVELLVNATRRLETIFRSGSQVFIPPYNSFNKDTLLAMGKVGLRIISSELDLDKFSYTSKKTENATPNEEDIRVYHMPQMTAFEGFRNHRIFRVSINKIIKKIDISISKYGYAVITIHPLSFIGFTNGDYKSSLDSQQIRSLENLIDTIVSKNIEIKTFSNAIEVNQRC
jgi:peptidoglycan/xylan/chitin deacetylase (PgdA/CDA1 family)